MAGVPVYSRQGRNGGWQLAGGGRTDLSGLNAAEARALFLVAGPSSSATPEVKAALRKLVRALPEPLRDAAEAASTAVVVDPTGWATRASRPVPVHLDAVQQAVVAGEQIALGYVARDRAAQHAGRAPAGARLERLGLVSGGGHGRWPAHVPGRPDHRAGADGRAGGTPRRLRPGRGVASDRRRGRPAPPCERWAPPCSDVGVDLCDMFGTRVRIGPNDFRRLVEVEPARTERGRARAETRLLAGGRGPDPAEVRDESDARERAERDRRTVGRGPDDRRNDVRH